MGTTMLNSLFFIFQTLNQSIDNGETIGFIVICSPLTICANPFLMLLALGLSSAFEQAVNHELIIALTFHIFYHLIHASSCRKPHWHLKEGLCCWRCFSV
jgi:hypothetical protein